MGDDALLEGLKASCRLLDLQLAAAQRLEERLSVAEAERSEQLPALNKAMADIRNGCMPVSDLYNAYTQPYKVSKEMSCRCVHVECVHTAGRTGLQVKHRVVETYM